MFEKLAASCWSGVCMYYTVTGCCWILSKCVLVALCCGYEKITQFLYISYCAVVHPLSIFAEGITWHPN